MAVVVIRVYYMPWRFGVNTLDESNGGEMKKELKDRLMQLVAEEKENPVDLAMLEKLRGLWAEDTLALVSQLGPQQRNALNTFLREIRDFMLQEIMRGEYGASIEAGFRSRAGEVLLGAKMIAYQKGSGGR
jgi:predicted exporter